ncbi:hypothetical protein [Nonomuraea phyllanthi]|uniref:hypothetical protein n=1 Tax=Nonomuraea phyllanthi TaxID=2219224 RepID=UPI0012940EE1|nr:hypothetical protein [Nonomuraea phyllanthi]
MSLPTIDPATCQSCGAPGGDRIDCHALPDLDVISETYQCRECGDRWNVWQ